VAHQITDEAANVDAGPERVRLEALVMAVENSSENTITCFTIRAHGRTVNSFHFASSFDMAGRPQQLDRQAEHAV
jgi:hypothetical protein